MFLLYFQEYITRFQETFPRYIFGMLSFALVYLVNKALSGVVKKRLEAKITDKLLTQLIGRVSYWIVLVFGIILAMQIAGLTDIAASLLAGAGVSAFVVGFAFKDIAENFLAGIILAFNRPFKINDSIEVAGITGKVKDVDLRNTHVKTFDGRDVYIPNALIIKEPLFNTSRDSTRRYSFVATIDFKEDVEKATEIILNAINKTPNVYTEKKPQVTAENFSSLGTQLNITFWVDIKNKETTPLVLKRKVYSEVKNALIENGIELAQSSLELPQNNAR